MNTTPEPPPGPEAVLPYPHTRNDCRLCGELDADFQIVEAEFDPPDWNGRSPRRFCQGCIGRWMATMAFARPGDTPPGAPWSVTVTLLRPGGGTW